MKRSRTHRPLVSLLLLLAPACGSVDSTDDGAEPGGPDAGVSEEEPDAQSANPLPTIDDLVAQGGLPGETVSAGCLATDPEAEEVLVEWQVTGGDVVGNGNAVQWVLPDVEGHPAITCIATDAAGGTVEETLEIEVLLSTDLEAHYRFDGDFRDSENGHDGISSSSAFVADRNGRPNAAISMTGPGASPINLSDESAFEGDEMTFALWLQVGGTQARQVLSKGSAMQLTRFVSGDRSRIRYEEAGNLHDFFIDNDKSTHIAVVRSQTTLKIYVDGTIQHERTELLSLAQNDLPIELRSLDAVIDDLRFYPRILTSVEIRAIGQGDL